MHVTHACLACMQDALKGALWACGTREAWDSAKGGLRRCRQARMPLPLEVAVVVRHQDRRARRFASRNGDPPQWRREDVDVSPARWPAQPSRNVADLAGNPLAGSIPVDLRGARESERLAREHSHNHRRSTLVRTHLDTLTRDWCGRRKALLVAAGCVVTGVLLGLRCSPSLHG